MDDLWTGLDDNDQLQRDAVKHERPKRMRHLSERKIIGSLRTWLLHAYAVPYGRSLGATRIFRHCYWIDALGGLEHQSSTSIETTPELEKPSTRGNKKRPPTKDPVFPPALQPIITLAQILSQESKPITFHGVILSAGSSRRKVIRQAGGHDQTSLKERTVPKASAILPSSWLEIAPVLLQELAQSPAIFLLNPLGATTFTYDDLAPLYQRTVPTELCLLLSHKQIEGLLRSAQHSSVHATTMTGLLRSDHWKTLSLQEGDIAQSVDRWIDCFIASMQKYFLLPVQRIGLPALVGPATLEALPYTLVFATRRQDSLAHMNDAVCLYQRQLKQQSWQGMLGEEWFAKQQEEAFKQEQQQVRQQILQLGRSHRPRRWPDLRQQLLLTNFGHFTMDEYNRVMWHLLQDGELHCQWRQQAEVSEELRIPCNDDTLIW